MSWIPSLDKHYFEETLVLAHETTNGTKWSHNFVQRIQVQIYYSVSTSSIYECLMLRFGDNLGNILHISETRLKNIQLTVKVLIRNRCQVEQRRYMNGDSSLHSDIGTWNVPAFSSVGPLSNSSYVT